MPADDNFVKVQFRLIYDAANFITWQLFYAGEELELTQHNTRASADIKLGEYRQLRWYAVSEKPEEPFTVRIIPPAGYRLRYPGVPMAKVDPDITGEMPKTPAFMDYSGWRRIKMEKMPTPGGVG